MILNLPRPFPDNKLFNLADQVIFGVTTAILVLVLVLVLFLLSSLAGISMAGEEYNGDMNRIGEDSSNLLLYMLVWSPFGLYTFTFGRSTLKDDVDVHRSRAQTVYTAYRVVHLQDDEVDMVPFA